MLYKHKGYGNLDMYKEENWRKQKKVIEWTKTTHRSR